MKHAVELFFRIALLVFTLFIWLWALNQSLSNASIMPPGSGLNNQRAELPDTETWCYLYGGLGSGQVNCLIEQIISIKR
jgi:hypothetical protein